MMNNDFKTIISLSVGISIERLLKYLIISSRFAFNKNLRLSSKSFIFNN